MRKKILILATILATLNVSAQTPSFPEGLPTELSKEPKDGHLPEPVFESGMTKLRVRFLGDISVQSHDFELYINTIFAEQKSIPLNFDGEGKTNVEFQQDGTVWAMLVCDFSYCLGEFWIAPGEETEVYIDSRLFDESQENEQTSPDGFIYTTGRYADLNRLYDKCRKDLNDWKIEELTVSHKMNGDEYTSAIVSRYEAMREKYSKAQLPQMIREQKLATLQQETLSALFDTVDLQTDHYKSAHGATPLREKSPQITISGDNAKQILSLFDTNSPTLLMGSELIRFLISNQCTWGNIPFSSQLQKRLALAAKLKEQAEQGTLTKISDKQREELGDFLANAIERISNEALKE